MPQVILDGVDDLAVDPKDHPNEVRTLAMLRQGLTQLATSIKRREARFAEMAKVMKFTSFGATSDEEQAELNMIACVFHWFGVSVCNYARLVGFIRGLERKEFARSDLKDHTAFDKIRKAVGDYVAGIPELAPVIVWRNKVAGHLAITDPRKHDNIATLDFSVMFPVTLDGGVYHVGGLQLTRSNSSGTYNSEIPMWSVTQMFESLIPRFWTGVRYEKRDAPTGEGEASAQSQPT